jgi:hypothetical protein
MTLVKCTLFRSVNVNALTRNFSTSHVLRTNYFRQMPHAPQLIRVGLSCARVSQTSKIDVAAVSLTMLVLRRTVFFALGITLHYDVFGGI